MTEKVYSATYSEMSRQSERQLGAFLALFALQFGSAYKPNKSIVEFRNSVIHKGLIPTPEEAQGFCSKVYAEILSVTERLQANLSESIDRVVLADLQERYAKIDASLPKATTAGGMFFSLRASLQKQSFDEAFRSFQEAREELLQSIPHMEALHFFLRAIEAHNNSFKPTPSGAA